MELSLTQLKDGEKGTVTSIKVSKGRGRRRKRTRSSWGLERRLMDMGLTPSTVVTVVKSAPFKGPIEIIVRGSRLALGRGVAKRVLVKSRNDG